MVTIISTKAMSNKCKDWLEAVGEVRLPRVLRKRLQSEAKTQTLEHLGSSQPSSLTQRAQYPLIKEDILNYRGLKYYGLRYIP